ncbi:PH domain-containing protein [Pseudalkalibacillus caeni]|uniref:YdbS-like PH domain-containing protein n=1 Tax=Exobacillus caeni TaxID=2574798 RepID=A0A5R9EWD6_9BACL|nr:PH domain-containing protein [Pseudalkalibacillus caeni]TLS34949.1 hypothetical protein FCL54_23070 [Pseudalkalibacillus caeni]
MRPIPSQRINQKALTVWRITGAIHSFLALLLLAGYFAVSYYVDLPDWISVMVVLLFIIELLLEVFLLPKLRWKRWRYHVSEHEIELMHGVFIIRRTLIPMVRVQHVDTKQGPLLRSYKLSTVTVSTAATVHEIPALSNEVADGLRDHISQLARVATDDV